MSDYARKRAYDNSDTEYEPSYQGPGHTDHGGRAPERGWGGDFKRQRRPRLAPELYALKELSGRISNLGDHEGSVPSGIAELSRSIVAKFDVEEFRTNVVDFVYATATEQPHKVFVMAALVQGCDDRVKNTVVEYVREKVQRLFDNLTGQEQEDEPGYLTRLKLGVRFLCALSPLLDDPESVLGCLETLVERSTAMQAEAEKRSGVAELVYFESLLSVPILAAANRGNDALKEACDKLMGREFEFKDVGYSVDVLHAFEGDHVELVKVVKTAVSSTHLAIFPEFEATEPGKIHLGEFVVPPLETFQKVTLSGTVDSLWKHPRFALELFGGQNFRTTPLPETYESLMLRDIVQDLVQVTQFNRITVSRQLLLLHHYLAPHLFAQPHSSEDKLTIVNDMANGVDILSDLEANTEIPAELKETMLASARKVQLEFDEGFKSTWKLEQVIVEAVLELMFQLPQPTLPPVYYQSLLVDTCGRDWTLIKRDQESKDSVPFATTLAEAIKVFYTHAATLNFDVAARYCCWVLLQISNFNFEWKWDEWTADAAKLGESVYHPTVFLLRNIIAKEVRVSTPKTIRETGLPAELARFTDLSLKNKEQLVEYDTQFFGKALSESVASSDDTEPSSEDAGNAETFHLLDQYLFNNSEHEYHAVCHAIYTNLQEGESLQSFNDLVVQLREQMAGKDAPAQPEAYIVALVAQSVCIIGSRSLSVIEKGALVLCGDKLRKILGLTTEEVENDQFADIQNTEERQQWLIEAVLRLWNNEPRIGYLILEKMRNKGLVRSSQIIRSLFGGAVVIAVTEVYADEVLDRLLFEEAEGETETVESKQEVFAQAAVSSLARLLSETPDGSISAADDAEESDVMWGVRRLCKLVESKLARIGDSGLYKKVEELAKSGLGEKAANELCSRLEQEAGVVN